MFRFIPSLAILTLTLSVSLGATPLRAQQDLKQEIARALGESQKGLAESIARMDVGSDQPFGRLLARTLLHRGHTLLAQIVDSLFEVATRFLQRFLAVHHAHVGLLTEFLYHLRGNGHLFFRPFLSTRLFRQRGSCSEVDVGLVSVISVISGICFMDFTDFRDSRDRSPGF